MRTSNPQQPLNSRTAVSRKLLCMRSPAFSCALAVMAALWGTESLPAAPVDSQQKHTASTAIAPTNKSPHPSKRHADKHSPARAAQPAPGPVIPDSPKPPQWPANDKPTEASVVWNSQGLRIDASNSSLQQILKDVAAATGATVEGLHTDERVFGIYGPGTARDVLAKLLDGSGYNVLMIGDQGQGSPRQIVLSARHAAGDAHAAPGSAQANSNDEDSDVDDQSSQQQPQMQPQPPPNIRNGFNPGGPPRTPQQIMQEMQQRQQQLQQQNIPQ